MSVTRRGFVLSSALIGMVFALPPWARAFVLNAFPVRTVEKDQFRFNPSGGTVKWKDRDEPYILDAGGLVDNPLKFTYKDLRALQQVVQVSDFHCVEGWDVPDVRWGGFRFKDIAERVRPRHEARFVVLHALGKTSSAQGGFDHYVESHPIEYLTNPANQCLMALDRDGKPLDHDHGAPLRVIAPLKLGYKNIKYVTKIEFSASPQAGWWTLANSVYDIDGQVEADRIRRK